MINTPWAPENDYLWQRMCSSVERIRLELDSWGGHLVALSVPSFREVAEHDPVRFGSRWPSYCDRHSVPRVDLFEDFSTFLSPLLEEVAAGPGYSRVWNTKRRKPWPERFPSSDRNLYLFTDRVHLTPKGHVRITRRLLETLQERGMLSP